MSYNAVNQLWSTFDARPCTLVAGCQIQASASAPPVSMAHSAMRLTLNVLRIDDTNEQDYVIHVNQILQAIHLNATLPVLVAWQRRQLLATQELPHFLQ